MQASHLRYAAVALVSSAALTVALLPSAQSQVRANPSVVPMGVSASGTSSTAWFHDPSTGRTIACQTAGTAQAGLSSIHCVSAKIPEGS